MGIKKWVKFKTDSSTRLGKIFLISTTDSFTGTVYVDDVRLEKVDDSPVFSLRPDCNLCGCPGGSSCSRTGECVANEVASLSDDLAFKILAIDAKYKPFCDEISSESMRDLCVDDLAVSTKDFLACDDIASPAKKSFCKNRIFTFLEKRSPVCGDTIVEGGEECESDSDCSHISSGVCGECVCYKSVEISFSGLKSTRSAKMDANIFANIDAGDLTNGIYVVKPVEVVYEEDLSTLKYQGKPLLGPYELVSAVADPYYHTFSCFETKCEGLCNLFGATKIMDFLAKGSMAIAKGVLWWLPTHFDDCFKKGEQSEGACDLDVKDKDGNLKAGWEFLSRKKDVNFKCNVMGTWFRSLTSGKVPQCKYADRLSTEIRQSSCYSIINGNNLVLSFPTYYAFQNSQGQNLGSSKTYWPKKPEEYKFSYTVRGMVVP